MPKKRARPKKVLTVPEWHRRRVAKQTKRMPKAMRGVMGDYR